MPGVLTPAIVLSVKDLGEADRLVSFLTPDRGRLTAVARHAKKSVKRFAHCLEPLSRVDFTLSDRRRGDLEFLQHGDLVQAFAALRRDLPRLAVAALLAELAGELASPPEAAAPIFAAVEAALTALENGAPPASLLPAYLLHLLRWGGYALRLDACRACGGDPAPPLWFSVPAGGVFCRECSHSAPSPLVSLNPGALKLLAQAQSLPREKLSRLRFPTLQERQCLAALRRFIHHHLGRDLKSWAFWDQLHRAEARP